MRLSLKYNIKWSEIETYLLSGGLVMKVEVGVKNCLYPLPTVLVGAMINGKPNFLAIAHIGIMDHECVSLGINKAHFTNKGIKENRTFSINVP